MESSRKSYACGPTVFLHGSSRWRGGTLGAGLAQLPAPGCQVPSSPCGSAPSMLEQHSLPAAAWAGCAAAGGIHRAPGHCSTPTAAGGPGWQQSPQAVVWDLLQLPMSGCCHPCPHHGPRANCRDEMVVLSGLPCSHPFVQGPFSSRVFLHCEPLLAEWGKFPATGWHAPNHPLCCRDEVGPSHSPF